MTKRSAQDIKSNLKGYTLIELLIVMAITGILFTIGYNGFQSYSRQQALLSLVRSIQVDLHSAQSSALAGVKPTGCNGLLNGYQFKYVTGTKYEIDANCSLGTVVIKTVTIPSDFSMWTPPIPNPIIFKSLAQGTNIPSGGTANVFLLQLSTWTSRTIVVGPNGNIQ